MATAYITPAMIEWARKRAGLSLEDLATKVLHKPDALKVLAWEQGAERPTFVQAQKIAKVTYIPFGYLYLSEPPKETLKIPDFRRKARYNSYQMSVNLKDVLKQSVSRQQWYRDYLIEDERQPLDFVGSFTADDSYSNVVQSIRGVLKIPAQFYLEVTSHSEYFKKVTHKAELAGILVFRSGFFGSNTTRVLDANEFRGFALVDKIAPLIFINTRDYETARIFTFFHELAHLWIGESGISDYESAWTSSDKIERFCNLVAAEILVPINDLKSLWESQGDHLKLINRLANKFRVSKLVVARRAFDCGLLKRAEYDEIYALEKALYKKNSQNDERGSSSGGNFYNTMQAKNGIFFSHAVMTELHDGGISYIYAKQLLDVGVEHLKKYGSEIESTLIEILK